MVHLLETKLHATQIDVADENISVQFYFSREGSILSVSDSLSFCGEMNLTLSNLIYQLPIIACHFLN